MSGSQHLLLGAVPQASDPNFEYTTLLLPGNGTNGAQNNTFLDLSTNAFSITRNGNTTQGTFSPFSQTGWGNYFDGTGDYLTLPADAAFTFGTGDFTIEGWVYISALDAVNAKGIFQQGTSLFPASVSNTVALGVNPAATWAIYAKNAATNSTATATLNSWTHFALVRSGTTTTLYANGTSVITVTSDSTNYTGTYFGIGSIYGTSGTNWNGYISNVRVVKGTAVYTANFTPSTTPLTAITNTSLLTCQSNRFVDNSSNAFAITRNGDVSVQAFSPFNPTAAWSAATNGGSGYFDGSGDYLTVSNNAALQMGSGDFTIEYWWYPTSIAGYQNPIDKGYTQSGGLLLQTGNGDGQIVVYASGSAVITASTAVRANAWNHMALVRNGTSLVLYLNGASVGSATNSTNFNNASDLGIGATAIAPSGGGIGSFPIVGYLNGVRFVKGTAVYTSAFTPPTAPLTAITNTQLLCNFTNAGIYDATSKNDLETVGNAQISTTQSKFGGSSIYFDGNGDYLFTPSSVNLQYGTGDFTIEFWWYPTTLASTQILLYHTNDSGVVGTGEFVIVYNTSVGLRFYINNNQADITQGGTSGWSANNWYHVAAVRYGNTLTMYRNGVSIASGSVSGVTIGANVPTYVGGEPFDPLYATGYFQDLRITKGIARYTSNFTPPTTAFLTL